MPVPYPVINLPDRPTRLALVASLWALGYRRQNCAALEQAQEEMLDVYPCISIDNLSHLICRNSLGTGRLMTNPKGYPSSHLKTFVNSPSHFLAYLRRHDIKPSGVHANA